jgi:hypothetical protein
MFKRKQNYKEDRPNLNRIKPETLDSLPVYTPREDSKVDFPVRGRQLNTKSENSKKKSINNVINLNNMSNNMNGNLSQNSKNHLHANSNKTPIPNSSKVLIQYQSKSKHKIN